MINYNLYSEKLRNKIREYGSLKEELSDVLFNELLDVLRKSNYHRVYIEGEFFESCDENNNEIENDQVDAIVGRIIHDYNEINPYEYLACELFRGKDF
jgi:Flp pilus assembly CpaF family ATPase